MRKIFLLSICVFLSFISIRAQDATEGSLEAFAKKGTALGACPLKHTDVKAEISGFLSRVRVTQEFENKFTEPIEAVYTFPLPQAAAVDDMTMRIGDRTIRGRILSREEARKVYERAKTKGQAASLLDQERPNIFTQAVANIMPNQKIVVEISYVETLKYEDGAYEFSFPMTVGPRYIPGAPIGRKGNGFAPDTNRVPDASRITPMPAKERAGHDISIEVSLDAGVPVREIRSTSHEIETANLSAARADIKLKDQKTIPNKDFVLRYNVAGEKIEDAVLTHRDKRGGFFTLILQPPDKIRQEDVTPKEIVFVLDTSGSMSGFPIEKAKEAMKLSLDNLYPEDTFNLITFAGATSVLFDKPVPATQANLAKAQDFLASRQGSGGTEMMKAIRAALEPSDAQDHLRVVCFMTDGYVGNDMEIIGEIQKHKNARVFSFGIGSSVNRFLLDKMAQEGNGEVEYVALTDDGSKAAKKFYERVRTPLLTDVSIDWNGLPVTDIYPNKIPDLFSAKPVVVHGRYTKGARGTIRLKGKSGGRDFVREIAVNFPDTEASHDSLATLWARTRIDDLMSRDWSGAQNGAMKPGLQDTIKNIGLEYRLMTQFTSFVAVEERVVNEGGKSKTVEVPVELPDGVNRQGIFDDADEVIKIETGIGVGRGSGNGIGSGNGSGGAYAYKVPPAKNLSLGVINGKATNLPVPPYPPAARGVNASGAVNVSVMIDENGNVIAASAVSGHPLLRAAAEQAARAAKFAPTIISGRAVKTTGVIVYNFGTTGNSTPNATVSVGEMRVQTEEEPPVTPEMLRRQLLAEKLHVWLFELVERLQKNIAEPTANEAKFVAGGKAEIRVELTEKTPEVLAGLKNLGFEISAERGAKTVLGRIAVEKLAALAELKEVQYVLPKIE